jgi:hypothetical protein
VQGGSKSTGSHDRGIKKTTKVDRPAYVGKRLTDDEGDEKKFDHIFMVWFGYHA